MLQAIRETVAGVSEFPVRQAVVIYGRGGFAREIEWLIESLPWLYVLGFADDATAEAYAEDFPEAQWVCAIGDPHVRARLMSAGHAVPAQPVSPDWIPYLAHHDVDLGGRLTIGAGTVICRGVTLTTDIRIGRGVQINLHCTVGHDVSIGDYATLSPGVHVSGCVEIGREVFIGTGAVISNGTQDEPIRIGDNAVIGAGAVVLADVPAATLAVGVPARVKS